MGEERTERELQTTFLHCCSDLRMPPLNKNLARDRNGGPCVAKWPTCGISASGRKSQPSATVRTQSVREIQSFDCLQHSRSVRQLRRGGREDIVVPTRDIEWMGGCFQLLGGVPKILSPVARLTCCLRRINDEHHRVDFSVSLELEFPVSNQRGRRRQLRAEDEWGRLSLRGVRGAFPEKICLRKQPTAAPHLVKYNVERVALLNGGKCDVAQGAGRPSATSGRWRAGLAGRRRRPAAGRA